MNVFPRTRSARIGAVVLGILMGVNATISASPYASSVVSYLPGTTPTVGYTTPLFALGEPERVTGEGFGFPGVVSMFNPPFGTDEIVSIGEGGHLTLAFDTPIVDSPANLFGADFILFTNAGFVDEDFPNGQIGDPPGFFGVDDAVVEVSADGATWFSVSGNWADGLFPTQGFLDGGPFDAAAGSVPTNFQKPVDPSLTVADFAGLTYAQALILYDGSGGGTPVDIASTGLSSANFVRIRVLDDGDSGTSLNFELDAISGVPEPATLGLVGLGLLGLRRNRGWAYRCFPKGFLGGEQETRSPPPIGWENIRNSQISFRMGIMPGGVLSLMIFLMTSTAANGQDLVFEETFSTDPIAGGRLVVHDGDSGRFVYSAINASMTASYDTGLPTARLIHALGETFTQEDDFTMRFTITIRSSGFFADPQAFAQLAMGAMNTATTGADRVGGDGGDGFDVVTADYFPNVTAFGGPSLGPTFINTDTGAAYFDHLDFEFGPETDLTAEGAIPLDTELTVEIVYAGCDRAATLTVSDSSGALAINTDGSGNVFGGPDGDPTTIQTVNTMPFAIDSVGILMWEDTFGSGDSTVLADVAFAEIYFEGTHLNPAARSDRDGDGDVDGVDFSFFASCFNKAGNPPRTLGCDAAATQAFDYDCDGDVDGVDFSVFASCFNKAGHPPRTIGCSGGE